MTKAAQAKSWTLHEWADGSNRSWPEPEGPAWWPSSVGVWTEISGTNLSAVEPDPAPTGTPSTKLTAWTSLALNTSTNRLYCAAGGGHTDYSGNEVDMLDLNADSPAWVEIEPPSLTVSNAAYYADGKPTSRHHYYGATVDETNGRVMLFGGSRYSDGGVLATVDSFDLSTNNYNAASTHPNIPAGVNIEAGAMCRDPSNDDVYVIANYNVSRWNRASNTWTDLIAGSTASFAQFTASAFDTTRNRIFCLGGGASFTYDLSGNATTPRSLSGSGINPSTQYMGMDYVAAIDRFLVRLPGSGGAIYQVDAATFAYEALSTSGGDSIPTNGKPMNKFRYVPLLKGCVFVPSYTGNAWFVRVHA